MEKTYFIKDLKTKGEGDSLEEILYRGLNEDREAPPVFFEVDPVPYEHGGTCVYICQRCEGYKTNIGGIFVKSVKEGRDLAIALNNGIEQQGWASPNPILRNFIIE